MERRMTARKVLQLSTYPIRQRISGGQRRAGAIHDAYRRAGFDIRYLTICDPGAHPEAIGQKDTFLIGPKARAENTRRSFLIDVTTGELFAAERECLDPLMRFWNRFKPDVVEIEHCYLWPGVKRLIEDGYVERVPIIYSSHNYETAMKLGLYERMLPPNERADALKRVRQAETELTRAASLVVAVSQSDAEVFRSLGAKQVEIVRNGSDRVVATPEMVDRWRKELLGDGTRSFALFVSSNHVPNYVGFRDLAGDLLAYLPPDACIVVVGGICEHMERQSEFNERMRLNRSRLRLLGKGPGDADLAAIVQLANAILLPITDGGGSNIKTVEALLSGRPIVGTSFAFRSYEEFKGLERVALRDSAAEFQAAIQQAVRQDYRPSAAAEAELEEITWPRLGDRFARIVKEHFASSAVRQAA
jgi:glycosyltransferase involved in cell wall biosynthesis